MTVRAWFTISAVAMAVLTAAFVYRFFFAPVSPPEILVTAAEGRIEGTYTGSCWPRRGDAVACDERDVQDGDPLTVARMGTLRIVVAFPQQPDRGRLEIVDASTGEQMLSEAWTDRLDYDLPSGAYRLTATARYPADAFVRYVFAFRAG